MRYMRDKNDTLTLRIDAELAAALNDLAHRLGDKNTSAAARWAIRVGLLHADALLTPLSPNETPKQEA